MSLGGEFANNFVCPYCQCKTPIGQIYLHQDQADLNKFFHLGICQNNECKKVIMFVYEREEGGPRLLSSASAIPVKLIHHYPSANLTIHEAIPARIADSYSEGIRCISVNANKGAVLLFRRTLQEICENKGADPTKRLNDQIDQIIPSDLATLAHEIRKWGNIGGHPDEIISDINSEDSNEMKELIDRMFDYLFIMPWKVQQSKAKRKEK